MKTYGDEGWISLLQDRMERARNRKIQNGSVFVGDEALGFAEREIIKDRLWMWLPEQFQKMPARMAKQKYPNAACMQQIYTNLEMTIDLCFMLPAGEIEKDDEEVFAFRDDIAQYVQQQYAPCEKLKRAVVKAGEVKVPWLEFVAPAEDTQIYNLLYFVALDVNKDTAAELLLGACNCPAQDADDWKNIFLQMLASMRTG